MAPIKISSLTHPLVKHYLQLKNSAAYRKQTASCLVMEKKIISELAPALPFKSIMAASEEDFKKIKSEKYILADPRLFKKITGMNQSTFLLAEIALPSFNPLTGKKILVLDQVADPGNVGTLLRTAYAFKWDGVFFLKGTADPFHEKALRAAKGASFFLPLFFGTKNDLVKMIKEKKINTYIADLMGHHIDTFKPKEPFMLVLGNEGHGSQLKEDQYTLVTIPLANKVDSLNVAIAGGILMYELTHG